MSEPRRLLKTSFASHWHWLVAALLAGPGVAVAVPPVTITPASGGSAISAETASNAISPAWTALGPITIAELNKGEFSSGTAVTLVLKVPAGFQFDAGTTPNASFTAGGDINNATVAVTDASTLTVTLWVAGTGAEDTLTLGGVTPIRARPTAKTPLATGRPIYRHSSSGGTANINSISNSGDGSNGSNFGDLTEVAGAVASVRVESKADDDGDPITKVSSNEYCEN